MHVIMTDTLKACEQYMTAREQSKVPGWHKLEIAPAGSKTWKQKTCTIGGNKYQGVQRVGHGHAGYVSKHGFELHT